MFDSIMARLRARRARAAETNAYCAAVDAQLLDSRLDSMDRRPWREPTPEQLDRLAELVVDYDAELGRKHGAVR